MQNIKITPAKLKGSVEIPSSKSMAHRAIICASLCKGISVIENVDISDDIKATINAVTNLGASVKIEGKTLIIDATNMFTKKNVTIDCNESGSTLRFLIPISITYENSVNFIGKDSLGSRPIGIFYEIFDKQNIFYTYEKDKLDLKINGQIKSDTFTIRGDVSSQFISGLMFALPLLDGDSVIKIDGKLESKSYIDLTIYMLSIFGVEIINKEYKEFIIKGNQVYKEVNYKVEGDYSQSAFFYCANFIGNDITVNGLNKNSLQGDKKCLDILNTFSKSDKLEVTVDATNCPDIIPIICVSASLRNGRTNIINAKRLRIKECDRLSAITDELNKIGGNVIQKEDSLIINGVKEFMGGTVSSHNDHRIAMSMAIASTRCKNELIIQNHMCVTKSYKDFWNDFIKIGGIIDEF